MKPRRAFSESPALRALIIPILALFVLRFFITIQAVVFVFIVCLRSSLFIISFAVLFTANVLMIASTNSSPVRVQQPGASSIAANDTLITDTAAYIRLLCNRAYRVANSDPAESFQLAQHARELALRSNDRTGEAFALWEMASAKETQAQYAEACQYAEASLRLAESLGDTRSRAIAATRLGSIYWRQGKYDASLDILFSALPVLEELNERGEAAFALNRIGANYLRLGITDRALIYYLKALALAEAEADLRKQATLLNNIGNLYLTMRKHDSALTYLYRAANIARIDNNPGTLTVCQENIGTILIRERQFEEARRTLDSALKTAQTMGNLVRQSSLLTLLARLDLAEQHAPLALAHSKEALDLAERVGAQSYQKDALELYAESLEKNGNHALALQRYRQFILLRDSLANKDITQKAELREAEYMAEKQEREILLLRKEAENQVLVRNSLLGGVILLCLLVFVVVLAAHRQAQARKQIEQHAEEIRLINEELQKKNTALEEQQHILEQQATEIQLANASLQSTNQELMRLDEEKNEFLSIAAHDLKSPLTGIMVNVSNLRRYHNRIAEHDRLQTLEHIEDVARMMTNIISHLLDINAIESGKLNVHIAPHSIAGIIALVVEHLTPIAFDKNIGIRADLPHNNDIFALIDPALATQILQNLLSNAITYSPPGKEVWIRGMSIGERVRVEVQDEGPGISDEDQQRLFTKFTRLSARPTGNERPTGLGLSIVKRFTEALNGAVWCESELGKGSKFIVEFPAAASQYLHS